MLLWIADSALILYLLSLDIVYSVIFRSVCSLFMSFMVSLSMGYCIIKYLNRYNFLQSIRTDGPKSHLLKQGTPTMGGIITLISVAISVIVWSDLSNLYVWYVLFIFLSYGMLGWVDDLLKIKRKDSSGLSSMNKYLWQSLIAIVLIMDIFILNPDEVHDKLNIWNILLAYFAIVGTSNSVNLSDGLDGLAIVLVIFVTIGLAVAIGMISSVYYMYDLHISYIFYVRELIVICVAMIGAGLGFLWFNAYPAQVFMGDVGSLSFGGTIGLIAVLLHQECLLLIMGGLFVIESLSVILQVICFKIFKKRIFKMAPIHHHFELQGYSESKIVICFWIISFILMLFGLLCLKIRII